MKLEKFFEGLLWDSRFVVLVAVIASLLASFSMFYFATVDAYYMISHLLEYASPALDVEHRNALRSETITHVVEIVDGYLLATVMLIFGLGLYELFISKIDKAEESEGASNVLLFHSLDDLRARHPHALRIAHRPPVPRRGHRVDRPLPVFVARGGQASALVACFVNNET